MITIAQGSHPLFYGIIWVICILLGMAVGSFICRLLGTILGWMIATSLDANIHNGGLIGKRAGSFVGIIIGIGLGIYSALHISTLIINTLFTH